MSWMPAAVEELLDVALVAELSVVGADGRPITYPLIPLWDGEHILMTSSILFSRKLEHLKADPRVSVSLTDPVALGGRRARATIQGDARVMDGDPHTDWERVLPLWSAKEPVILGFLKERVAFPLFFERAVIEITPRRVLLWPDGDTASAPVIASAPPAATPQPAPPARSSAVPGSSSAVPGPRRSSSVLQGLDITTGVGPIPVEVALDRLASYPFLVLTWIDESGRPVSAAVEGTVEREAGRIILQPPAGLGVPAEREVNVTGSHIRPQPGFGYDERRHLTVWGRVGLEAGGLAVTPRRAWGWDEADVPFPEYVERTVGQSRRYLGRLASETGRQVRPRLSRGWLFLRATRLPFLSATFVPVGVGLAIAAAHGAFDAATAILTLVGAAAVHLGLNVANDVFDTRNGADDINVNPTKYSGGSRVIQYGLVSAARMTGLATAFYAVAIAIGLLLLWLRGSPALLGIGVLGIVLSIAYTAPPLKLVYRGLGELTTALGFGPLMLLGAYVVQTRGAITAEPVVASVPIAILVALILYVNEVPDRRSDERAGKRTLPVRLGRRAVVALYAIAVVAAFATIVGGVAVGLLPVTALAALVGIPLAWRVHQGLRRFYEQPYGLMAVMAVNIRLHLVVGGLLLVAYLLVIAATVLAPGTRLFLR